MTTTAELRSKKAQQEQEISAIAHRIEDRIESYKDWHTIVREYPLQSLGVAVGAGILLTGSGNKMLGFAVRQTASIAKAGITAYLLAWLSEQGAKQTQLKNL